MPDQALFVAMPYLTAAALPVALIVRYLRCRRRGCDLRAERRDAADLFGGPAAWWYAVLALSAGHVGALLLPQQVLAWNQVPWRLAVLEATAFLLGAVMVLGVVGLLRRSLIESRARPEYTLADCALLALLFVLAVSGLVAAARYRWASTWSAVTWTPYVVSLFQLRPRPELIATMPYLVKLHVFASTAALAVVPWTHLAYFVLDPVDRAMKIALRPMTWAVDHVRSRVEPWGRRAVVATASWWEEEG
jgi:nitrate reductase gamma subunit